MRPKDDPWGGESMPYVEGNAKIEFAKTYYLLMLFLFIHKYERYINHKNKQQWLSDIACGVIL